jgi:hypothetical protein
MDAGESQWTLRDGILNKSLRSRPTESTPFAVPTLRNQQVTRSSRVAGSSFTRSIPDPWVTGQALFSWRSSAESGDMMTKAKQVRLVTWRSKTLHTPQARIVRSLRPAGSSQSHGRRTTSGQIRIAFTEMQGYVIDHEWRGDSHAPHPPRPSARFCICASNITSTI